MTRQKSRPNKKKRQTRQQYIGSKKQHTTTLTATIVSQFVPSLPLKSRLLDKHTLKTPTKTTNRPKPGSIFSSGRCRIGHHNAHDTYTVRIKNASAAETILDLTPGTRIQLIEATFVNAYGDKKEKEISARSFHLLDDISETHHNSRPFSRNTCTTSATPSISWVIYPTEFGVKQKNGVTLHRPLLKIPVRT